jgi:hypothetical protein
MNTYTKTTNERRRPTPAPKTLQFRAGVGSLLAVGLLALVWSAWAHVPVTQCPPVCRDFMTGGGWIPVPGTLCNNKGTFGFVGGLNAKGELFGSANYIDHCTGDHAKGDDVIAYCFIPGDCPSNPDSETCRRIVYTGRFNNVPGYTIVLDVCDNGEPGTSDTFAIKVLIRNPLDPGPDCDPNGVEVYSAEGTLGGGGPGGGNIQLHRQCD